MRRPGLGLSRLSRPSGLSRLPGLVGRAVPDPAPARENPAFRRLGNFESGTVAALSTPSFSAVSGGAGCLAITC